MRNVYLHISSIYAIIIKKATCPACRFFDYKMSFLISFRTPVSAGWLPVQQGLYGS